MNLLVWFCFSVCSFLAVIILAILGTRVPEWSFFIPAATGLISSIILLKGILLPTRVVNRGMELIKCQDFNNRLVKVGEANSDRIVAMFNDIIDKLRAERLNNREQEGLLRLLIEASPMGVMMLDFDGYITLVNKSFFRITGLPEQELKDKKPDDLDSELLEEMMKISLGETGMIRRGNLNMYRCYHLNFIQNGFKRHFYLIESLTEEIMRAERAAYEKVIRIISHEVNNTIGGVQSVLEILKDNAEDNDTVEVIESCSLRCEKMGSFISSYADIVKMPEPVMKDLDLNKEVELLVPFLSQMAGSSIRLHCETSGNNLKIRGDSGLLQQVVINIIKNACESIETTGNIWIKTGKEKGFPFLKIYNDGAPLDTDALNNIFSPFYSTKKNGKGIGLMLVKEILGRHKADYGLQTETNGLTVFHIHFPSYSSFVKSF